MTQVLGGRYQLEEPVGAGGTATVWKACDLVLQRPVAVKILAGGGEDPDARERLAAEARFAAQIAHPNVAAIHDFGTTRRGGRGDAYLVMELLDGPLLSDYLRAGPLDWRFAARICAELAAGLAAAHAHRFVHRDVKPANVVLTRAGVKLLDFGIAAPTGMPDRTEPDTVLGTVAYLPPERFTPAIVTPAFDLFAVGAIFYQCLTGTLPWPTTDLLPPYRPTAVTPPTADDLPLAVADWCIQCLQTDPQTRPTAIATALILAANADVQVHVPTVLDLPRQPPRQRDARQASASTDWWADAPTHG